MGQAQGATPLDYAPPPSGVRRRLVFKLLIGFAIVFVTLISIKPSLRMLDNFRLQRQVRRCMAHPIPEGVLVYSSDNPGGAIDSPDELALEQIELKIVGGNGRSATTMTPKPLTWATVFMGELKTPGGTRSFVNIEAGITVDTKGSSTFQYDAEFVSPDGAIGGNFTSSGSYCDKKLRPAFLMYSAKRDPNDPSHISFRYCTFSETHVVDGYLNAMGGFNLTDKNIGP
jgi:hypothetical protein